MFKRTIYFDNAATSHFKPLSVKLALLKALNTSANPGRSGHKLSLKNAIEVWNTRQKVADYFNIKDAENVIFTKNCTEALNIAIFGLLRNNNEKKHVICSCFEHNSVLRPLHKLKTENVIELDIVKPSNNSFITLTDIKNHLRKNTFLVCLTHISNVTGNKNDIKDIGKLCNENNILFLVDSAQSCGHVKIDMTRNYINFLTFAGHKGFLSPQGIGGLCINCKEKLSPITYGGTGTESQNLNQPSSMPESLESGTIMTPNILALKKGIEFVEKHFKKNNEKVKELTKYLLYELKKLEEQQKIKIYTANNSIFGVVSFEIVGFDSVEVSNYLDENYNIAVRSGLHCSPLTHKFLNTEKQGLVRVSLNFKNSKRQIKTLLKAIKKFLIDKSNLNN